MQVARRPLLTPQVGWEAGAIQATLEKVQKNCFVLEGFDKRWWLSLCGKFRVHVFARLDLKVVEHPEAHHVICGPQDDRFRGGHAWGQWLGDEVLLADRRPRRIL
jgi:hypothetical protein